MADKGSLVNDEEMVDGRDPRVQLARRNVKTGPGGRFVSTKRPSVSERPSVSSVASVSVSRAEWYVGMAQMARAFGITPRLLCKMVGEMREDLWPVWVWGWSCPKAHAALWCQWYYWKSGCRRRKWLLSVAQTLGVEGGGCGVRRARQGKGRSRWYLTDERGNAILLQTRCGPSVSTHRTPTK